MKTTSLKTLVIYFPFRINKKTIVAYSIVIALTACKGQNSDKQNSKEITTDSPTTSENQLTKIYSKAIADYITEVYKQKITTFDTLFFGKRKYGQPDDFPDIELPETIKNIKIKLIEPELGQKLQAEKKSRVYINLMGWVDKKSAEFIFITFSNGFEHKFDFCIKYKYNSNTKEFDITNSRIEKFSK